MRFINNFEFNNLINFFIQNVKIYNKFENRFKSDENDKNNKNDKINVNNKIINDFELCDHHNYVNIIKLILFFNEFKFEIFFFLIIFFTIFIIIIITIITIIAIFAIFFIYIVFI